MHVRGLPWWLSVYELACQCRAYKFDPYSRKIPYAAEQLTCLLQLLKPTGLQAHVPQQEKPS